MSFLGFTATTCRGRHNASQLWPRTGPSYHIDLNNGAEVLASERGLTLAKQDGKLSSSHRPIYISSTTSFLSSQPPCSIIAFSGPQFLGLLSACSLDPRADSVGEAESRVVITEVTLLVFRQLIPVVSSAFIAQSILPSDIEEKYDGAEDT